MAMQTLMMGFGGSGAYILTALKELSVLKSGRKPDSVHFLLFDTIAGWEPGKVVKTHGGAVIETIAHGSEKSTSLDPSTEYFHLRDRDPDLKRHVRDLLTSDGDPDRYPQLKEWLHAPLLGMLEDDRLDITEGAAQQRQIGRFAIFQNAERLVDSVRQEIRDLRDQTETGKVNVWLVGSSAGGTGAGCLIDAAFLTRLAAGDIDIKLTGVIVLPEVYEGKFGISPGRAYSMFRELERVQSRGFHPSDDKYVADSGEILARVQYDSNGMIVSRVQGPLFDYLFYAGRPCTDQTREQFFTAVANCIDPYLDEDSARILLGESLNDYAAASSFGAARIYVPSATLGELFACEQVSAYIDAAAAPSLEGSLVQKLHSGEAADRQHEAREKAAGLLPLFQQLLAFSGKKPEDIRKFGVLLTPQRIVQEFFALGGASTVGIRLSPAEQNVVKLTFVNPYYSYTEEDIAKIAKSQVHEIEVKTLGENKQSKGPKENNIESRDRFLRELEQHTKTYLSHEPVERSLEKGKRLLLEKLSRQLKDKVNSLVCDWVNQQTEFAVRPNRLYEGTPITRLRAALTELVHDQGPLIEIEQSVLELITAAEAAKNQAEGEANGAIAALRVWKQTGHFGLGPSVDSDQKACRDAQGAFVEAVQRLELLRCMQRLIRDVKSQLKGWHEAIERMLSALVLREKDSAYARARQRADELRGRLYRLSQSKAACIHLQDFPDDSMHGYRARLQGLTTIVEGKRLFEQPLGGSRWDLSFTDPHPVVKLFVPIQDRNGNTKQRDYDRDTVATLYEELRASFQDVIDSRLRETGVFDYIQYLAGLPDPVPVDRVAEALAASSQVLLNAGGNDNPLILLFRAKPGKEALVDSIQRKLGAVVGREITTNQHSDANSLTFLRIRKPNLADVQNISQCQDDYIKWQIAQVGTGDDAYRKDLGRALVFHPFRTELEAWYIERCHFQRINTRPQPQQLIPPRVVRLLENPAMMQAFVQAIATGAIARENKSWIWRKSPSANAPRVVLTDYDKDGLKDVLRAAVVFVLRQKEGRARGITAITLPEIRQSITAFVTHAGKPKDDMLAEFRNNLDDFLKEHFPSHGDDQTYECEINGLRMIFEYYCDPDVRTDLTHRIDLAVGVARA